MRLLIPAAKTGAMAFISLKHSRTRRGATRRPLLNATIDKDIHRAIGFLEAGQTGAALACVRTVDAACEASHLRCNLAGLVYLSAKQNSPALEWFDPALEFAGSWKFSH
jgi:hypothetical protein